MKINRICTENLNLKFPKCSIGMYKFQRTKLVLTIHTNFKKLQRSLFVAIISEINNIISQLNPRKGSRPDMQTKDLSYNPFI